MLGVLALAAAACTSPPAARGWAPPEPVPAGDQLLLVAAHEDTLFGLQGDPEAGLAGADVLWQFPPDDLDRLPLSDEARDQIAAALDDIEGVSDEDRADFEDLLDDLTVAGPSVDDLRDLIEARAPPSDARDEAVELITQATEFEEEAFDDLDAFFGRIGVSEDRQRGFAASFTGTVFALDLSDGTPVWVRDAGDEIVGGVAVQGDRLYFGTKGETVFAIDAETGDPIWAFETDGEVWATPTVADDTIYVPTLGGVLYALSPEGEVRWEFDEADAGIATRPLVASGVVVVGSFDDTLYGVDAETGELAWAKDGNNWFWAAPAFAEDTGTVFAATLDGTVYAVDVETGQDRWPDPFDADEAIRAGPAVTEDALIVATTDGLVFKLDLETGAVAAGPELAGEDILADIVSQDGVAFVSPRAPLLFVIEAGRDELSLDPIILPE